MDAKLFRINIHSLKEGEHVVEFTADADDLGFEGATGDFEIIDRIRIRCTLYKVETQFSLNTELKGKFRFVCDRCLENYEQEFNSSFDIIYKYDFKGAEQEQEDDDNIKFISPNTKYIDLKEDLRDYVLLSIPMRKVPEDIDGTCSYCGRNTEEMLSIERPEEINPVWEKLLKQKK